ncbi:fungal hydrophobin [Schizopora paradoxa]|uniref:Hydrophobin n=1 Tax=Schizopora paradoxa TaxID=27342 RepID=A0A0H2RDI4_9AGAM|nr:fungal hydrophobin [Schizopora paradoxa]
MKMPSVLLKFFFLFAILAVAIATPQPSKTTTTTVTATPTPVNQCNVGSLQCCDSVQSASSGIVQTLLKLLGIVLGDITGEVGLTCSPITGIGLSGDDCNASPVCCTGNSFNGIIVVGCSPININL